MPASKLKQRVLGFLALAFTRAYQSTAIIIALVSATTLTTNASTPLNDVFLSEIHYDNRGTDRNEAIKLAGKKGTDLTGWTIELYNGKTGTLYSTLPLHGKLSDIDSCRYGYLLQKTQGLQNGSPDGIALVTPTGDVAQFISYEGAFTAKNGSARNLRSIDINVEESSKTNENWSLQYSPEQKIWLPPRPNSFGKCATTVSATTPIMSKAILGGSHIGIDKAVKIHDIQGNGEKAVITTPVNIAGIVTASYQATLKGFVVQEEDKHADSNLKTSEAIFVYCGRRCIPKVSVGDLVSITGAAKEYYDLTQLIPTNVTVLSTNNPLPKPIKINLPLNIKANSLADANKKIAAFYEPYENMLVTFTTPLTVSDHYSLTQFGQLTLSANGRLQQYTHAHRNISEAGHTAHKIDAAARSIILDDGSSKKRPKRIVFLSHQIGNEHPLRTGDTINNLTGILMYSFSKWIIQPIATKFDYRIESTNPRPPSPTAAMLSNRKQREANLTVASFNLQNFFTTLNVHKSVCGPKANKACRGANTEQELKRQQEKIVSTLCLMNADIVGLTELQNPARNASEASALKTLVAQLNRSCGDYQAIAIGSVGTDAITSGMIYKPSKVTPRGQPALLNSSKFLDPLSTGFNRNRPAIAQTFTETRSSSALTIVVNHFKSKGSKCGANDDDNVLGQGNCNATRTEAAKAQVEWLATHPTGVATPHILVIGDLNAYRFEAPISVFTRAGFNDVFLTRAAASANTYSYSYNGQIGYLDHALASTTLTKFVTEANHWHINADELALFDYNEENKPANYHTDFYTASPYRSSDHDPIILSITLPQ